MFIRRMGLPHTCPQMQVPGQMRVPTVARRFCVISTFPFSTSFPWLATPAGKWCLRLSQMLEQHVKWFLAPTPQAQQGTLTQGQ